MPYTRGIDELEEVMSTLRQAGAESEIDLNSLTDAILHTTRRYSKHHVQETIEGLERAHLILGKVPRRVWWILRWTINEPVKMPKLESV